MRALALSCVLVLSGCSLALDPARWMGGDPQDDGGTADAGPRDGGSDAGPDGGPPPECTSASECTGTRPVCTSAGTCLDCDGDADDFLSGNAECDAERADAPADCDDARADVHPGAAPVCGDGAVNDCVDVPADVGTALGVQELGVEPLAPLYVSTTEEIVEIPTIVALQSSGGEINAAIAVRARDTSGSFVAWLLPFDHTAPAPVTPVLAAPSARDYYWVSAFDVWATSPTQATTVVHGVVSEMFTTRDVPFFGSFTIGTTDAVVDPVEPDRTGCPFADIVARAWSPRRDWYAFVGRNSARTVYSLHAVSRGGSVDCVPDLGALGIDVGEFPQLMAAGDVVLLPTSTGELFVWKPGGPDPQSVTASILGSGPIAQVSDYEYLVASQGSADGAVMSLLDCNRAEGCVELGSTVAPTLPGYLRALPRWGSGAALVTVFDGVPAGGGEIRHGVEVRLVDSTGAALGGDFAVYPWEITHADGVTPPQGVTWMGATTVPRVAGSSANDLLIALVLGNSDTTATVGVARVRGCTER